MTRNRLHIRFGRFELDEGRYALLEDGAPVAVGPKPLAILFHLARHRDRVVRKEELLEAVWPGTFVSDDAIWQSLFKVRAALGDRGAQSIETIRGVGFRFLAEAQEVGGSVAAAVTAPAPSGPALIGRVEELDRLRAALARVPASGGGLVLVAGEPGVGKTRLANEILGDARRAGFAVHEARGHERAAAPAFWLFAQLLRSHAGSLAPEALRDAAGEGARELGRISPELRERLSLELPAGADSEEARFRLFDALASFLRRTARTGPQLLLLDDLQCADPDSLAALGFLAGELRREPVLFIATTHDYEVARNEALQDLLIEFAKRDALVRVTLRGLSPPDVGSLVEAHTGLRPPDDVVALLHQRTDGNPFFIGQVLELVPAETRASDGRRDLAAIEHLPIPTGMRRVASRRLAALSPPCREVLEVAATLGTEFSFALLAQVHGGDRGRILEALDEAAAGHVVFPTGGSAATLRFQHDVLHDVLYAELPGTRRAALHRDAGCVLEALHAGYLPPVVPALAHHFAEAAALGAETKAVDYAKQAGDLARQATAYADCADHYERALRMLALGPPAPRRRAELLVCLGYALRDAGRNARARSVLLEAAAVAKSTPDASLLALAALGVAEFYLSLGDREAIERLAEALALLGEEPLPLRVRLQSALAVQLAGVPGRHAEAARLAAAAEDAARTGGAPRALAMALLARARIDRSSVTGQPAERVRLATEAIDVLRDYGETTLEVTAVLARHGALLELGDLASADVELRRLERHLGRLRSAYWRNTVPFLRAGRALLEGRFDDAEPLAEAGLGAPASFDAPHPGYLAAISGAVLYEQGRGEDLLARVEALLELEPEWVGSRAIRLLGLVETGRTEEARPEFEALAASGFAEIEGREESAFELAILSLVCMELGHAPAARTLAKLLEPRADYWVVVGSGRYCAGPVALHLARLALCTGDVDAADRLLETALERAEAMRSPPWRAHVLATMAFACARRATPGSRRRARSLAAQATGLAEDLGMARLREQMAAATSFRVV